MTPATPAARRTAAPPAPSCHAGRLLHPLIVASVLAAFSIARQGFQYGIENNVFHIPIVLGWAGLPQFHDDPLIQSLR